MGGEDHFARDAGHGFVKAQAFILHAVANRFQHRESAVPFVQMKNAGRDAHGFQRAEAADAQQQLLPDADAPVSAIQPRSELAVLGSVAFHVGVEQQQIAASHFHAPDLRPNGSRRAFRSAR